MDGFQAVAGLAAAEALPLLAARLAGARRGHLLARHLADFGPLAAGSEGLLRDMLAGQADDWARAEGAHALWRIGGDARTAADVLAGIVAPLADGAFLPVRLAAMRYLAVIPGPGTEPVHGVAMVARSVLDNPRRLAYFGGWRVFDEDDQIRVAAGKYLAAHQ